MNSIPAQTPFSRTLPERDDVLLADWQNENLARGAGCVQCGKPAIETRFLWDCCGGSCCRRQLGIIWKSYEMAAKFRGVSVPELVGVISEKSALNPNGSK